MICPAPQKFELLMAGHLTDEQQASLDRHLLICESCRDKLAAMSEDPELAARIVNSFSWPMADRDDHACDALYPPTVVDRPSTHLPSSVGTQAAAQANGATPPVGDVNLDPQDQEFLHRLSVELRLSSVAVDEDGEAREDNATSGRGPQADESGSWNFLDGPPDTAVNRPPPAAIRFPEIEGLIFERVLGEGGMGIVFKAYDTRLRRAVAVKVLRYAASSQSLAGRLRREAEAAARLNHPSVVRVYAIGELEGLPYVVMEYVSGGTLGDRLQGQPQPPRPAARIVQLLAEAVDFAHQRSVIHRDIKPRNILLECHAANVAHASWEEITPKVADFGLAKLQDHDDAATRSGQVLGTPAYAAPEQLQPALKGLPRRSVSTPAAPGDMPNAEAVGPAADIYSLGVLLYQMLTGRPPLQAEDLLRTIKLVLEVEPLPPQRLQPGVPQDLQTICLRCLAKDPSHRYASAAALADDLGRFLNGEPILAKPPSPAGRLWRWALRNRLLAAMEAAAALLLAALMVSAAVGIWLVRDKNEQLVSVNLGLEESGQQKAQLISELRSSLSETKQSKAMAENQTALARAEEAEARRQRERADKAAAEAVMLAERAKQLADRAANENYFSLIAAANLSLEYSESLLRQEYLRRCIPQAGEEDRRGWEWHYLNGIRGGELFRWNVAAVMPPPWEPTQLLFSPDGHWLAMAARTGFGADNGLVMLWDVRSMRFLRAAKFEGVSEWHEMAFSTDGKSLVAVNATRQAIASWTLSDMAPEKIVAVPSPQKFKFILQATLVSPIPTQVGIVHTTTNDPERPPSLFEHGFATAGAVRDDGNVAATADADGRILIRRTKTGQQLQRLLSEARPILAVAISPTAPFAVTIARDRVLRLWDLSRSDSHFAVRVSPSVKQFLGATPLPAAPPGGEKPTPPFPAPNRKTIETPPELVDFAFSPDESAIARVRFGPEDGLLLDTSRVETGETVQLRWLRDAAFADSKRLSSCLSDDGARFAVPLRDDSGLIALGATATGEVQATIEDPRGAIERHWLSPNGKWLATIRQDNRDVLIWDTETGKLRETIAAPATTTPVPLPAPVVTFDRWKERLAIHYGPAGVTIVRLSGGRRFDGIAKGVAGPPARCAFDPRGRWLAIKTADDRQVALFDIDNPATAGDPEYLFTDHDERQSAVAALEFSPAISPPRLATVGMDGKIHLWNPDERRLILRLAGTRDPLQGISAHRSRIRWSGSGRKLAVDLATGIVDIWDAPPPQEVEQFDRLSQLPVVAIANAGDSERVAGDNAPTSLPPATRSQSAPDTVDTKLRQALVRGVVAELETLHYLSACLRSANALTYREIQEEHVQMASSQARLAGDLSPWLRLDLGFVFAVQGDWKQAAAAWCPPSVLAPRRSSSARDQAYLTARRIVASDVPLDELLKHAPDFPELAIERDRPPATGDREAWRQKLLERLETDPDDPFAARYLALALVDALPATRTAVRERILFIARHPRVSPFTLLPLALIEHGKLDVAAKILRDAPPPNDPIDKILRDEFRSQLKARVDALPK